MDECDGCTIIGHRELRFRKNPPPAVKCEFPKAPYGIGRESCESGLRANLRIRPPTIPGKNRLSKAFLKLWVSLGLRPRAAPAGRRRINMTN